MCLSENSKNLIQKYITDTNILMMRNFNQHRGLSTYDHSIHVAVVSAVMAENLRLSEKSIQRIITGAILHDYYLYDYHNGRKTGSSWHCWTHPRTALKNASKDFDLDRIEKNIIRSHMFPATLLHIPVHKESWIVSMADKYCTLKEFAFKNKRYMKTLKKHNIRLQ